MTAGLFHSKQSRRTFVSRIAGAAILTTVATPRLVTAQTRSGLKVIATFSILADWIQNIGDSDITITSIVPPGGDAHTFDPDPQTVAAVADADLIFAIGPGFDGWITNVIDSSGTKATYVEVTSGMELLSADDQHHEGEDEHEDSEHDEHGSTDPHVWGDAANAVIASTNIVDALTAADPDRAEGYRQRAEDYTAQLQELDSWIRQHVKSVPEDRRKIVTNHDTFGYYAYAYGFEVLGTALSSVSTESGDPSAKDIAALVASIQEAGVPAIFAENVVNPDLMQSIADAAGVELAPPLYTDALGEPDSDGATYIDMMRYNTTTIVDALSG